MRVPTRFFVALITGLLLASATYFGLLYLQLGVPSPDSYWCYEINKRKTENAAQIGQPKLLLVGGSSTLFGLSAGHIEHSVGVPTINMSTHAALGASYILRLTQNVARPGDFVLLAFEYDLYELGDDNKSSWAGQDYISYLMARDPAYLRQLPLLDQLQLGLGVSFRRLWLGLRNRGASEPRPAYQPLDLYNPDLVDAHGDMTGHTNGHPVHADPANFKPRDSLVRGINKDSGGFEALAHFTEWARNRGVHVLATYPSICKVPEYDNPGSRQALQTIRQFFGGLNVPIVGTPQEAMLPRSEFLDTAYHLNQEAARARTDRLLEHLKPHLSVLPRQQRASMN